MVVLPFPYSNARFSVRLRGGTLRLRDVFSLRRSEIAAQSPLHYPIARKSDQSDTYFGTTVADPYRWLENTDSPETKQWIDAENALTFQYLGAIPERASIKEQLTRIWNYPEVQRADEAREGLLLHGEQRAAESGRALRAARAQGCAEDGARSEHALERRHGCARSLGCDGERQISRVRRGCGGIGLGRDSCARCREGHRSLRHAQVGEVLEHRVDEGSQGLFLFALRAARGARTRCSRRIRDRSSTTITWASRSRRTSLILRAPRSSAVGDHGDGERRWRVRDHLRVRWDESQQPHLLHRRQQSGKAEDRQSPRDADRRRGIGEPRDRQRGRCLLPADHAGRATGPRGRRRHQQAMRRSTGGRSSPKAATRWRT